MNKNNLIYLAGVILFGLIYAPLNRLLGDYLFVGFAIVYLLALRFLAEKFGKEGK